jgi:hypothetical protein
MKATRKYFWILRNQNGLKTPYKERGKISSSTCRHFSEIFFDQKRLELLISYRGNNKSWTALIFLPIGNRSVTAALTICFEKYLTMFPTKIASGEIYPVAEIFSYPPTPTASREAIIILETHRRAPNVDLPQTFTLPNLHPGHTRPIYTRNLRSDWRTGQRCYSPIVGESTVRFARSLSRSLTRRPFSRQSQKSIPLA